jgi:hypothetical protein
MQALASKYAPATVDVLVTSTALLAADSSIRTVEFTNKSAFDVWYCVAPQVPVVGSGFYLPANQSRAHGMDAIPLNGVNAIADGGTAAVAVGRG